MAITEARGCFWQHTKGPERGLDFPEMAMKNKMILATVILLATLWVAVDAGITALTFFS
jgi:hypothetical protein